MNTTPEEPYYLVSAKHVVFDDSGKLRGKIIELICQPKDSNESQYYVLQVDLDKVVSLKHADADVAVLKLGLRKKGDDGTFSTHFFAGVTVLQMAKSSTISVGANSGIKLLKEVFISNDVFLQGYPSSLGLKSSPQFEYDKPLLRKGIVASINPKQGTIILDCPVYYGNSGGVVIEKEQVGIEYRYNIIGVVSQFIPFVQQWTNPPTGIVNTEYHNSGYSVAVSMDKIFELINFKRQ